MIKLSAGLFPSNDAEIIKATIFPDRTSQVWKLSPKITSALEKETVATISWDFESEAEFIWLAQLVTLLQHYYHLRVNLHVPYLPYARQDKPVSNETTFALQTFAKLINSLNLNEVHTLDAHSNKADLYIHRLEDRSPREFIEKALFETKSNLILFPDAGAQVRYGAYFPEACVHCDKVREQLTGRIVCMRIYGSVKNKKILIVDDLCDGGATFKMVAEQAMKEGAKAVHLFVTHGIFSKGIETLRQSGIERIFTYQGEIK